ncbi:SIR2 family protein, partial [Mycoplasma marinum]
KRYTKFESRLISESLIKKIGDNKLILSFNSERPKLEIDPLSYSDNEWFIEGYDILLKKLGNKMKIMTLNYDKVLEKILGRKAINFIEHDSKNHEEEIIHLHGVVDDKNQINSKSLLTLGDYVEFSKIVEDKLSAILMPKQEKDEETDQVIETVVIIGSSLSEEHLLRVFKDFQITDGHKDVILVVHETWDAFYYEKLKEIYSKLGVKIVNINFGHKYEEDFKTFWEELSISTQDNNFTTDFGEISKRTDIVDNELYERFLNLLAEVKEPISLEEFYAKINWIDKNNNILVRPIYWLEKHDKKLKKNSLKKFMMFAKVLPIEWLNMIRGEIYNKEEFQMILIKADKLLLDYMPFGYDRRGDSIKRFINREIHFVDEKEDIFKHKNILRCLVFFIFHNDSNEKSGIIKYAVDNFGFSELSPLAKEYIYLNQFPDKNSNMYKLFKNDFDNKRQPFLYEEFIDYNGLLGFIDTNYTVRHTWKILMIFNFKPYRQVIMNNLERLNLLMQNEKNTRKQWFIHELMYFVFIKSKKQGEYLALMEESQLEFDTFPSNIHFLGHEGFGIIKYSKYDGATMRKNLIIKDFDEFTKVISEENLTLGKQRAIKNYITNNMDVDLYKLLKDDFLEKIDNWGRDLNLKNKKYQCATWDEYFAYMDHYEETHWLEITPPQDIFIRINEIHLELTTQFSNNLFNEILKLSNLKLKLKYYGEYFWDNKEIRYILDNINKNKKAKTLIFKLITQKYNFSHDNVTKLLNKEYFEIK